MTERIVPKGFFEDLRRLIEKARHDVARAVNSTLVVLYWKIGARIHKEILKETRAEYGQQIISALSRKLVVEFGSGFSEKSLRHMARFAEVFPDEAIVSAVRRQLGWSHLTQLPRFLDHNSLFMLASIWR